MAGSLDKFTYYTLTRKARIASIVFHILKQLIREDFSPVHAKKMLLKSAYLAAGYMSGYPLRD